MTDPTEAAEATMREAGAAIVTGVDRLIEPWVRAAAATILDAWGRLSADERQAADRDVATAAAQAHTRVVAELRDLFATPVAAQRTTPLAIVRTATVEVTVVLAAAGIPEIERDPFEVRIDPEDVFGLAPKALGDLGDPDLGGALLAWGVAKSRMLHPEG